MQNQKVIEQLGYTPKEAKVYLASLHLGEAHISDIAAKAKMPRSSAQLIVDKLHADGLMNFYVMRRYKYWVAEKPEQLLLNLKKKEQVMAEALPKLAAIRESTRNNKVHNANHKKCIDLFQKLADASPHAVLITNSDIEIEYINASWKKLFGYTLAEVQGESPRMFKSGKTPRAVYERMWKCLNRGHLFQTDEIIDKKKDGTHISLATTIFILKYAQRTFYVQVLDENVPTKQGHPLHDRFLETVEDLSKE